MATEEGVKLRGDVERARVHFDACVREYLHRVDQLPSLPRPDGTLAVQIAAEKLKNAIDADRTAHEKLGDFLDRHPEEGSDGRPM